MGANIGTCMTAILSSIGVNRDAKRVTVIHVAIKLIGTVIWLIVFYSVNAIFDFDFLNSPVNIVGVAAIHSVFNIANTILLFPFSKPAVPTPIIQDAVPTPVIQEAPANRRRAGIQA